MADQIDVHGRCIGLDDIGFVVVTDPQPRPKSYVMHFKAFKVNGRDTGTDSPSFDTPDGKDTDKLAEADVFCEGFIRFDGCMNFRFQAQDHGMLHCCGVEEAKKIGLLFDRLYQIAEEHHIFV